MPLLAGCAGLVVVGGIYKAVMDCRDCLKSQQRPRERWEMGSGS